MANKTDKALSTMKSLDDATKYFSSKVKKFGTETTPLRKGVSDKYIDIALKAIQMEYPTRIKSEQDQGMQEYLDNAKSTIQRYKKGERTFSVSEVRQLAMACDSALNTIFMRDENEDARNMFIQKYRPMQR